MGLSLEDISKKLFPKENSNLQHELITKCCDLEVEMLKKYGGELYPEVKETLEILKKDYHLSIVSNCQEGYIESFFEGNKMGKFFNDYESAGKTGLTKAENTPNGMIIR